jgi:elongation factor 1-delta
MIMAVPMMHETIWFDKWRCEDAERAYQEKLSGVSSTATGAQVKKAADKKAKDKVVMPASSLVSEIARAREQIQMSLKQEGATTGRVDNAVISRIESLEQENKELKKVTDDLRNLIKKLENRITTLECGSGKPAVSPAKSAPKEEEEEEDEEDDDFELFGSDEDDDEAEKLKEKRLQEYAAKKAKKPQVIAKSSIVLEVKPWDDETDMQEMEKNVRSIEMDGLLWGASKLVPVGYGIKKLQIGVVVEDEKVSIDDLTETIEGFEDYVQSVDIAAFNKI